MTRRRKLQLFLAVAAIVSVIAATVGYRTVRAPTSEQRAQALLDEFYGPTGLQWGKQMLGLSERRRALDISRDLEAMGPDAVPHVAAAIQRGQDPYVEKFLYRALSEISKTHRRRIGREIVPHYMTALTCAKRGIDRRMMITALGRIGPAAAPAVPALIEQLDAEPEVEFSYTRCRTAIALGGIGPAAHAAVPALIRRATTSPDNGERGFALFALSRIAPTDGQVVTLIIRSALIPNVSGDPYDEAYWVRMRARMALENLPDTPAVRQAREAADAAEMAGPAAGTVPLDLLDFEGAIDAPH